MLRLRVVCCATGNGGPDDHNINKAAKLARIRNTRKNHAAQLNRTLNELSVLTKTSTASRGVIVKVNDALYDVSLLTKTIHLLDVSIDAHAEPPIY